MAYSAEIKASETTKLARFLMRGSATEGWRPGFSATKQQYSASWIELQCFWEEMKMSRRTRKVSKFRKKTSTFTINERMLSDSLLCFFILRKAKTPWNTLLSQRHALISYSRCSNYSKCLQFDIWTSKVWVQNPAAGSVLTPDRKNIWGEKCFFPHLRQSLQSV